MAHNWKAPPKLKEPYSTWKEELTIWSSFTDLPTIKQGAAVFLSLPDPSSARDAVLELGSTVISAEGAVKKITDKLDSLFLKDKKILSYQAWKSFINFKRPSAMNMVDYTIEFNKLYTTCKNNDMSLPTGVLAIQFLESANLPEAQHKLALATCASMEYEEMKSQILKIFTSLARPTTSTILQPHEIKVESDTLAAECYDEEQELYDEDYPEEEVNDTLYGYRFNNKYQHGQYNRNTS